MKKKIHFKKKLQGHLQFSCAMLMCSSVFVTACGKSTFSGIATRTNKSASSSVGPAESELNPGQGGNPEQLQNPAPADPGNTAREAEQNGEKNSPSQNPNDVKVQEGSGTARQTPLKPDEIKECEGNFSGGKILIVDLKSGWFAGDGGEFFADKLTHNCPEKPTLSLDYLHITKVIVESNRKVTGSAAAQPYVLPCLGSAASKSWQFMPGSPANDCHFENLDSYGQVWVLSGDDLDELDVPLDSALLKSLLARLKERSSNLNQKPLGVFLGAGLSNITHANAVATNALGLTEPAFIRHESLPPGTFPSVHLPEVFKSQPLLPKDSQELKAGQFDNDFFPLKGLKSIFDYGDIDPLASFLKTILDGEGNMSTVQADKPQCFGDQLNRSLFKARALDRCGKLVMGTIEKPGLKLFADSNMARFYGLEDPLEHVTRIAHFLNDSK